MKYLILCSNLVLCLFCLTGAAYAAPAATVQSLTPQAWASSQGQRLDLAVGQELLAQDSLHTGVSGALSARFSDGTELNMSSSTSVDIADYIFDDNSSFTLNIGSGIATLVSGAIVQQNPEAFRAVTPLGTVGIRGTTIYFSVSNDKVSIVVTDMAGGHSVVITGLDGQSVIITEPGMQVDLIRGEPTPLNASPVSSAALSSIENLADKTYSELPHRDTGEQSMLVMEQDMNSVNIINMELANSIPTNQNNSTTSHMTYPAFLLGLDKPVSYTTINGSMSNYGRYVAMWGEDTAGTITHFYLQDMSTGRQTLIHSTPLLLLPTAAVSNDGSRVMYQWGTNNFEHKVYDIASGSTISFSSPISDNPSFLVGSEAISGNGNVVVGYYNSLSLSAAAVSRWDYNGTDYQQVAVYDAATSDYIRGNAYAINVDGTIIAGGIGIPAYWISQGGTTTYNEYLVDPASFGGQINALSNDGKWGTGFTLDGGSNMSAFRVNTTSRTVDFIPAGTGNSIFGYAISDDGKVVGGAFWTAAPIPRAFFWTPDDNVMQMVDTYLSANGVNLGGASLNSVVDISGDGSILLCTDTVNSSLYLVRIDGKYLGITTPNNIYASLAEVAAGSSSSIANSLPIAGLSNTSGFSLGTIPSAGEVDTSGGSVLRVWASGTFSSDYSFNGDDKGASGSAGATYFMDNGFSIGGGVFHSYRSVDSLWGSNQKNKSISLGLYGGYAPERTGVRLSGGLMGQSYDLDTRRNYPNGTDMDTSIGKGRGWGLGLTGHAGWVFAITDDITIQPFAEYTFQRIATPDYSEQGGAFPVDYNRHYFNQNITRLGADLQWDILPGLNMQLWLAWNHRFEDEGPASSGHIIGWDSFYFPGSHLKQDWGDTGIGMRWRVYDNTTLGWRLGFGIDNRDSGLPDMMSSFSVSIDI